MPCDIFLSYTRMKNVDGRVTGFRIHLEHDLYGKIGTPAVIFQDTNIEIGSNWSKVLEDEIKSAKIFLLLLSPTWITSEWCNKEFTLASQDQKKIIVSLEWEQLDNLRNKAAYTDILSKIDSKQKYDGHEFQYKTWVGADESRDRALGEFAQKLAALLPPDNLVTSPPK